MKFLSVKLVFLFASLFVLNANATPVLIDWAFNVDNSISENANGDVLPGTNTLDANGFGEVTLEVTGVGSHSVVGFFDFEIDEANNTFFNEFGSTGGTLATGQSWEIDEPGFVSGDIYDNMLAGSLDNTNSLPVSAPDDVSFALGWDFILNTAQTATITFALSDILSTSDFFLQHTDNEVGPSFDQVESVFLWSSIEITGDTPVSVSEPQPLWLAVLGLLAFVASRKRKVT